MKIKLIGIFLNFGINLNQRSFFKNSDVYSQFLPVESEWQVVSIFDKLFMLFSCTPSYRATTDYCAEYQTLCFLCLHDFRIIYLYKPNILPTKRDFPSSSTNKCTLLAGFNWMISTLELTITGASVPILII